MNRIYFIIVLIVHLTACNAQNKLTASKGLVSDSIINARVHQIDFSQYVEKKTIGEFLNDIGQSYSEYLYSTIRPHYLQFVFFVFSDSLWLEIEPSTFEYSSIYSARHRWDVEKLKKEKIADIRLYYNNQCTKVCRNRFDN